MRSVPWNSRRSISQGQNGLGRCEEEGRARSPAQEIDAPLRLAHIALEQKRQVAERSWKRRVLS